MAPRKTILIEFPGNRDGSLTHQIRNLGEDLWREIELTELGGLGGLDTIDRATGSLKIEVFHVRKVGMVRQIALATLKRHFLDDRSEVTYI